VIVAFTLTFGSLMLGLALAFGLGGKDLPEVSGAPVCARAGSRRRKQGERDELLHCERDKVPVRKLLRRCSLDFGARLHRLSAQSSFEMATPLRPSTKDISKYLLNKNLSAPLRAAKIRRFFQRCHRR